MPTRSAFFVLGLLFAASPLAARELTCTSQQDIGHEGYLAATARIELDGKTPHKLSLESLSFFRFRNAGFTCNAEFDRNSPRETWSDKDGRLTIRAPFEESDEESILVMIEEPKGYRIDLSRLSEHYCGARVRWPLSIFVPKRGGRCLTAFAP